MSFYETLRHFADSYGLVVIFALLRCFAVGLSGLDPRRAIRLLPIRFSRKTMMGDKQGKNGRVDAPTGTEFVGHEWDGIEELDTPMPRWWVWCYYLTIAWGVVYLALYPAWPLLEKGTEGVLGWTSRGELAQDLAAADKAKQSVRDKLAAASFADLENNPALMQQAVAGGAAAFKVNCVQCHGSGAAGSQVLGYPNLADDDWLWGGDLGAIEYTLNHGIRQQGDEATRTSIMPAFEGVFDAGQLSAVTNHVMSFTGKASSSAIGAQIYSDNCAQCHGANGAGERLQGAPNLADAIWLYGDSTEQIKAQILAPRMGMMPKWQGRLDPVTIKMLSAYVHSLGGGEKLSEAPEKGAASAAKDTDEPA